MRRVFVDTSYWLALANHDSPHRRAAGEFSESFDGVFLTTGWVLTELGNSLSRPVANRTLFLEIIDDLSADPAVEIVPFDEDLFHRGIDLYRSRPDKEWSLVDCVSFAVMQERGITEALTTDHHFEQAGFAVLLK